MEVPAVEKFEDIYPGDAKDHQTKRWNMLLTTFEKQFGEKADFVSRSPGRVNIIGEVRALAVYLTLAALLTESK